MKHRELVMLAHRYTDQDISDYVWSEKLDGLRAIWIPWLRGSSPAWMVSDVQATGLFSRYGRVFRAPDWWLDLLPTERILDGELIGGTLSETQSICRSHTGDWSGVRFNVIDSPASQLFTQPGQVRNIHFEYKFTASDFMQAQVVLDFQTLNFEGENYTTIKHHEIEDLTAHLEEILGQGGEGLILRKRESVWLPYRTKNVLKVTDLSLGEGTVTGYTEGKGKFEGMVGAVEVDGSFLISGFTDDERRNARRIFPIDSKIKYKFSRRTSHGLPQFARFIR